MIIPFLLRWLVTSLTILMIPSLISGVSVRNFGTALAAALVLGILNTLVKPILVILTLPLTFLTLGFFLLIINALMFQFAGALVGGLHVATFGAAFLSSIVVSLVSWAAGSVGDSRFVFRMRPPGGSQPRSSRTVDMHHRDDGKWE